MAGLRNAILKVLTGTAMGQLITFGLTPFLTRSFDPADFGRLSVLVSVASFVVPLATLKLELGIPLESDARRAHALTLSTLAWSALVGVLTTLVVVLLIAAQVLDNYWLPLGLIVSGLAWGNTLKSSLSRQNRFGAVANFAIANSIIRSALPLLLLSTVVRDWALIACFALGQIVASAMSYRVMERPSESAVPGEWKATWKTHANFIKFSLPADLFHLTSLHITPTVLVGIADEDFTGQHALASRIVAAPGILISTSVSKVFYPRLARAPQEEHAGLLESMLRNLILLSASIFGLTFAFAPLLFVVGFGAQWAEAATISRCLIPYLAANLVSASLACYLLVRGKQRSAGIVSAFNAIIRLGCIAGGARLGGEYGVVLGYCVGGLFNSLIITVWVARLGKVKLLRLLGSLALPLFAIFASIAVLHYTSEHFLEMSAWFPETKALPKFWLSR